MCHRAHSARGRCARAAGFPPGDGLLALLTLNAYVLGDVLDLQAEDGRPAPSERDADPAGGQDRPPASSGAESSGPPAPPAPPAPSGPPGARPPAPPGIERYPLLRAATGALSSPGDRFEHGLGILIDGLRARHDG